MKGIRGIILLFLVSSLSQFPLSLIRFVAPLYALELGAKPIVLGLMGASYGAVYIFLASYFGRLSGRIGHKKMIASGLILYAMVIALYPYVRDPYFLILVRGGEAVGMSLVWPSLEALSKVSYDIKRSIMAYTLSWSISSSIAPYAGAYLMGTFWLVILAAAVLSLAGAAIALIMPHHMLKAERKAGSMNTLHDIMVPIFLFGFNTAVVSSFYPAFGKEIMGVASTGTVMTVAGIFMVIAFAVSSLIKSESTNLTFMGVLLQLLFLPVFLNYTFTFQIISLSCIFFGQGLIYFNVLLRIVGYFEENVGSKTGLFESSIGAGSVLGPLISGLPTIFALRFPWLLCFLISLALFVIFVYNFKRHNS